MTAEPCFLLCRQVYVGKVDTTAIELLKCHHGQMAALISSDILASSLFDQRKVRNSVYLYQWFGHNEAPRAKTHEKIKHNSP